MSHATLAQLTRVIMFERLGFGILLATLVLFLMSSPTRGGLALEASTAIVVASTTTAMLQLAVLLGGWALDRWPRQAHNIGSIGISATAAGLLCLGALSWVALNSGKTPEFAPPGLAMALLLLALGNGLFKPTITLAVSGWRKHDQAVAMEPSPRRL
jgi:dipeptide/tripeptide permease